MTTSEMYPRLPFPRRGVLDLSEKVRVLRAEGGLARVLTRAGDPAWLVTGYAAARQLFDDERLGRAHPDPERASQISTSVFFGGPRGDFATETETHRRLRRVLVPLFSARRVNRLRPRIQVLVDDVLDQMARGEPPADLHEQVSVKVPVLVICELLGVSYGDHERLEAWEEVFTDLTDADGAVEAHRELTAYMSEVVQQRRREPGEDVISSILASQEESGFSDEYVAELAMGVLHGGYQNTVARIDQGMLYLFLHPEQRDALRQDPSLAAGAVEEILRIAAPDHHGFPRYARTDIEIEDVTIRAGDAVMLSPEIVNRDADAYPDPDRFDITRDGQNPHLAFGHGPYYCIGAGLARAELEILFGTIFRRFPGLRLGSPLDELRLNNDHQPGGLVSLPVTW